MGEAVGAGGVGEEGGEVGGDDCGGGDDDDIGRGGGGGGHEEGYLLGRMAEGNNLGRIRRMSRMNREKDDENSALRRCSALRVMMLVAVLCGSFASLRLVVQ